MARKDASEFSLLYSLLNFTPLWEYIGTLPDTEQIIYYLLFSGGPDSVGLAMTLKKLADFSSGSSRNFNPNEVLKKVHNPQIRRILQSFFRTNKKVNLVLLHLNHKLRPTADEEAEWVRRFAAEHGLICTIEEQDISQTAKASKASIEEAGRYARYNFLLRFLNQPGAIGFTAHTLDDHAESVILNLAEKTGLGGLLGIAPVLWGKIYRPFLGVRKSDILSWLEARKIKYLTDESNLIPDRPRTFIRHRVIPLLVKLNPQARENILETSSNLRDYEGLFSWALETIGSSAAVESEYLRKFFLLPMLPNVNYWMIDVFRWRRELINSMNVTLRSLLKAFGFELDWREAEELAESIKLLRTYFYRLSKDAIIEFHLPSQMIFLLKKKDFNTETINISCRKILTNGNKLDLRYVDYKALKGLVERVKSGDTLPSFSTPPKELHRRKEANYMALFSSEVTLPLIIREWKRGDCIKLSRNVGTAKLSDIFTNKKIPRSIRESLPVVTDANGEVLWVPGVCRSQVYYVSSRSRGGYFFSWRVSCEN